MIHIDFPLDDPEFLKHVSDEYRIIDVDVDRGRLAEIFDICWDLEPHLEEWLNNETEYYEYDAVNASIAFELERDAVLFKLTWF